MHFVSISKQKAKLARDFAKESEIWIEVVFWIDTQFSLLLTNLYIGETEDPVGFLAWNLNEKYWQYL